MSAGPAMPVRWASAADGAAARPASYSEAPGLRGYDRTEPRIRPDLRGAERYTRIVAQLKVLLPAVALVIVAGVVFFSSINGGRNAIAISFDRIEDLADDRRMINPKLSGVDDRGRPYLVTADYAEQERTRPDRVTLVKLDADMTLENGQWVLVTAEKGLLDGEQQTLDLDGRINLYSGTGYEVRTTQARIDFETGRIVGEERVIGQGPLGVIIANGFEVDRARETVLFTRGVETTYIPPPRVGERADSGSGAEN